MLSDLSEVQYAHLFTYDLPLDSLGGQHDALGLTDAPHAHLLRNPFGYGRLIFPFLLLRLLLGFFLHVFAWCRQSKEHAAHNITVYLLSRNR